MEEINSQDWHLLDEADLARSQEAQDAKQESYIATFYRTDEGRRVLFDLYRYMQTRFPDGQEWAMAALALDELYQLIKANAGINESEVIEMCSVLLKERN